jgi:carbamoyl-phosphate synthase small subunit
MEPASMRLLLEDGTELVGRSYGAQTAVAGEVVFNTGMTGYVETLTDPSYKGQILVMTYPLVGNYGVPAARPSASIDRPFESSRIQVQGLVVQTYVDNHSHHAATRSLAEWLKSEDVPLLSGIDTRLLTQKLREKGTMRGFIVPPGDVEEGRRKARQIEMRREVFRAVAPKEVIRYPGGAPKILLIDAGAKDNFVRSLFERGASVIRAPYFADFVELAKEADGILLGNGPGDPKDLAELIDQVKVLLKDYRRPIFGVCLGNQILGLGGRRRHGQAPYGHRGVNQPVQDLLTRRCYITSQNHGYAVRDDALPADWEPWFVNLNDGTNEGIRRRLQALLQRAVPPRGLAGPRDTGYLFDDFLRLVGASQRS